jgi:hypothetical protein
MATKFARCAEAFAENGLDVQLWHPFRYQVDPGLRDKGVFDYYGIRPIFRVRELANWDVVQLNVVILIDSSYLSCLHILSSGDFTRIAGAEGDGGPILYS